MNDQLSLEEQADADDLQLRNERRCLTRKLETNQEILRRRQDTAGRSGAGPPAQYLQGHAEELLYEGLLALEDFTAQQAIPRRLELQFQRKKRRSAAPRASNCQEPPSTHSANAPAVPLTATDVSQALDEKAAALKDARGERRQPGEAIQQVTSSGICSSPRQWERVTLGEPGPSPRPARTRGPNKEAHPPLHATSSRRKAVIDAATMTTTTKGTA